MRVEKRLWPVLLISLSGPVVSADAVESAIHGSILCGVWS
jgi:hypothetical protein